MTPLPRPRRSHLTPLHYQHAARLTALLVRARRIQDDLLALTQRVNRLHQNTLLETDCLCFQPTLHGVRFTNELLQHALNDCDAAIHIATDRGERNAQRARAEAKHP